MPVFQDNIPFQSLKFPFSRIKRPVFQDNVPLSRDWLRVLELRLKYGSDKKNTRIHFCCPAVSPPEPLFKFSLRPILTKFGVFKNTFRHGVTSEGSSQTPIQGICDAPKSENRFSRLKYGSHEKNTRIQKGSARHLGWEVAVKLRENRIVSPKMAFLVLAPFFCQNGRSEALFETIFEDNWSLSMIIGRFRG